MKLRGKNLKGVSKEQRKKMQQTLNVMEKNREKDDSWLRDLIKSRLETLTKQKLAYNKTIQELNKQAVVTNRVLLKVDGAIEILNGLLATKRELKND